MNFFNTLIQDNIFTNKGVLYYINMTHLYLYIFIFCITITTSCSESSDGSINSNSIKRSKLVIPTDNKIYHAAFPDFSGTEDIVTNKRISDFEVLTGKKITWAYFSNNWTAEKGGVKFPKKAIETISKQGSIPFIRMMPRSSFKEGGPDPTYTMDAFLSGKFDTEIKQWATDAKNTNIPLLVEFGTEVNGKWFPWNAKWNGMDSTSYGDPNLFDGMEKFRDVYRHIITLCNEQGVKNITWFYHIDAYNDPTEDWNTMKGYYPGDDYIDWIGISVYGVQSLKDLKDNDDQSWSFEAVLNDSWDEITTISAQGKPIAILEWGIIDYPKTNKDEWITDALKSISPDGNYYPHIKAISYWHENFNATNLRIDSSPKTLNAYKKAISNPIFISKPVFVEE